MTELHISQKCVDFSNGRSRLQNKVARCFGFSFEFWFLFGWLFVWLDFDLFCVNIGSHAAQADLKLTM